MSVCDMCGKDTRLVIARIEGTELNVCSACCKHGQIIRKPVPVQHPKQKAQPKPEVVEVIVSDYAHLIRTAREKSRMTQKEFAKFLNEKESIVNKLEGGSFKPPIAMAKKLQKLLRVKLVEIEEEEKVDIQGKTSGPLTIGDLLKVRK